MREVEVALGERSYVIRIGRGVLAARHVEKALAGSQVAVVTNSVVAPLWLPRLEHALAGCRARVDVFTLPDGEAEKTLGNYAAILDFLIERRHNRSTTIIALGGGVVGDMAGFAAATYQRGVALVQAPTTLLAQVDSSVGGKTAVNHARGKNLIGAFHQPRSVLIDTDCLATLPDRELRAGLAEVVKYGAIRDEGFLRWLEEHAEALLARDEEALTHAIARSCEVKADVVAADERETGLRAILNFGHTFGHAIETLTGYDEYLHGEAVAMGMVLAADLSARLGMLPLADAQRLKALLGRCGLPVVPPPGLTPAAMLDTMAMDKKVLDARLRLVLCRELGAAYVDDSVPEDALLATLKAGAGLCE
jgi:3-dehydroquinate synthase